MQARDFCFWLQGYFELAAGKDELTAEQANTIRAHFALVFQHDAGIKKAEMAHPAPALPSEMFRRPQDFQKQIDATLYC